MAFLANDGITTPDELAYYARQLADTEAAVVYEAKYGRSAADTSSDADLDSTASSVASEPSAIQNKPDSIQYKGECSAPSTEASTRRHCA